MSADDWYKDAIFYELHVRAFQDSNGDGIGDFRGLTERSTTSRDLGVTTASGCCRSIPRRSATTATTSPTTATSTPTTARSTTFDASSTRRTCARPARHHRARHEPHVGPAPLVPGGAARDPSSPYRDYYVWSDTDQRYRDARIIFTDTEPSNWTWDPVARQYFWHRFFSHQPDLNFDNPRGPAARCSTSCASGSTAGVDGFRVDAVPYLFEREGTNCENLPETHAYPQGAARRRSTSATAAACCSPRPTSGRATCARTSATATSVHMAFHFPLMPRIFMALRREDRRPIIDIIGADARHPAELPVGDSSCATTTS